MGLKQFYMKVRKKNADGAKLSAVNVFGHMSRLGSKENLNSYHVQNQCSAKKIKLLNLQGFKPSGV